LNTSVGKIGDIAHYYYSISDHNLAFFVDNGESNDGDGSHGRDNSEHVAVRGGLQSIDLILL